MSERKEVPTIVFKMLEIEELEIYISYNQTFQSESCPSNTTLRPVSNHNFQSYLSHYRDQKMSESFQFLNKKIQYLDCAGVTSSKNNSLKNLCPESSVK